MQTRTLARLESARPVRFLQSTSKMRLVAGRATDCEEAILEVTRQKGSILQVLARLSLGVQQSLDSLDDFIAMGEEELEQFDVGVERHLANFAHRRYCHPPLRFSNGRILMNASTAWILPS